MPILQYRCTACQKEFEELVKNCNEEVACPDCGKKISVFGESHIDQVAEEYKIPVLARIPIDPKIARMVDEGTVEYLEEDWLDEAAEKAARMNAGA